MAEKQSILGRIAQLTKANINALIDRAEDPQKMLDQLVRDYTSSIAEAEDAVAVTIGNLRLAEQDHAADIADARDWGQKALAAAQKAEDVRARGDEAEAARFDTLAKVAIGKQISAENEARAVEPMISSQNEVVDKLKEGLQQMRVKLDELKSRRDQLVARSKTAHAQKTVQGAIASINILDPTSEISRFEEQVRREEAYVAGQAELQGSSIEDQFAELEDYGRNAEVEARLAALKGGSPAPQQIGATAAGATATGTDEGSADMTADEDKTAY
ncbi:PspA/IM30 family protein [Georgenia yuyongxinii]|uniref:PspA/IM30 family protein n=1 Tax=Georgenia yuyongxinii TaxID=2589797 RepID=A0A5B8BZ58_9MICO|nr:PspA/IM30 family protein [Georgenia yuyongxinii]QDC23699.1 PspA/IM30 family protein [Georgenia yuyongxinii]